MMHNEVMHEPFWLRSPPGASCIMVVDPASRKLAIPVSAVLPTNALHRTDRIPSICMLFLDGRCRQGVNCHQIHAEPRVVERIRAETSRHVSCCQYHGEGPTVSPLASMLPGLKYVTIEGTPIPASRLATTNGVYRLISEYVDFCTNPGEVITIQRNQVCRLHMQGRCRYAEDCNFVHLCQAFMMAPENATLNAQLNGNSPSSALVRTRPTPLSHIPPLAPPYFHQYLISPREETKEPTPATPAMSNDPGHRTPPGSGRPWRHEPYSWQCVSPLRAQ